MTISSLDKTMYQGHIDAVPPGQGNCHKYLKNFKIVDDVHPTVIREEIEEADFAFNNFRKMLFQLKVELTLTEKKSYMYNLCFFSNVIN